MSMLTVLRNARKFAVPVVGRIEISQWTLGNRRN
jgi:hypothetical protein